jgi:uncharacterized membrane protein
VRTALLILHLVGVAGWLGGGIFVLALTAHTARREPRVASALFERIEAIGSWFFGLSVGLVLLSGVGLVLVVDEYSWGQAFILIGFGIVLLSGALQGTLGERLTERLKGALGTDDYAGQLRAWRNFSLADVSLLLIAVWVMVTRLGA